MCSFINSVLVMIFLRVQRLTHQTITVTLPDCIFKQKQRKKIKNKNIWGFDGIVFKRPIHHQIAWFVKIPSQSMYPLCCVNPPEKIVFKFLFSDARKSAIRTGIVWEGNLTEGLRRLALALFFSFLVFVCLFVFHDLPCITCYILVFAVNHVYHVHSSNRFTFAGIWERMKYSISQAVFFQI